MEKIRKSYRCEKCSRSEYRYILGLNVSDHTDSVSVYGSKFFNDTGNIIIGRDANELNNMKEWEHLNHDPECSRARTSHLPNQLQQPPQLRLPVPSAYGLNNSCTN